MLPKPFQQCVTCIRFCAQFEVNAVKTRYKYLESRKLQNRNPFAANAMAIARATKCTLNCLCMSLHLYAIQVRAFKAVYVLEKMQRDVVSFKAHTCLI